MSEPLNVHIGGAGIVWPAAAEAGASEGLREAAQAVLDAWDPPAHKSKEREERLLPSIRALRAALVAARAESRVLRDEPGASEGLRLVELQARVPGSCDWGDCDNNTMLARWDHDQNLWLPVCQWHAVDASAADLAPVTVFLWPADLPTAEYAASPSSEGSEP